MSESPWRLYTDGACRGNPGQGSAGAVLVDAEGTVLYQGGKYLGTCTNNIAEYEALILGLSKSLEQGATRLRIFMDSELLVKQVTGEYRVKNGRLQHLMAEVKRLLSQFTQYDIMHIPREENRLADQMANQALDEGMKVQAGQ